MGKDKRRVLIIGGQFAGNFTARDLKKHFQVTIVDAKEFFEYTPGILRAYVKPCHFDSLSFTLEPVYSRRMGVKFVWGEVKKLDGEKKTATVKTMYSSLIDEIAFDYCVICAGCNFGPFSPNGESLWFPVIHEESRKISAWSHIDERFIEGRRRHILEEYHKIKALAEKKATVLVVGAGFIGVEWVTELEYYFPALETTIIDFLPRCLGPLPTIAAEYCSEYMVAAGIKEFYNKKYEKSAEFYASLDLPDGPDCEYVCIGVKASNYFMPKETLSEKGPGGGGWIHFNEHMQVTTRPKKDASGREEPMGEVWADGTFFAVGDCNYGCIGNPKEWVMPPVPKISYPGEEQAMHAIWNLERLDAMKHGWHSCCKSLCGRPKRLRKTWWPWGAGMFATSLGPHDACFVMGASDVKESGYMVNWWIPAALQKEIIETTKIDECRDRFVGKWIWHFVHHTPVHLWGKACSKNACCPSTCCY